MKKGNILFLLVLSILILGLSSQVLSQETVTVGEYIQMLTRALGLEDQLPPEATPRDCLTLLLDMEILPATLVAQLLPILDEPLNYGTFAVIMVDVWRLSNQLPPDYTSDDCIALLVAYGLIEEKPSNAVVRKSEIDAFFANPNVASALAEPYLQPASPVKPSS